MSFYTPESNIFILILLTPPDFSANYVKKSFIVAFIVILLFMGLYYMKVGAVLTLPGIAGIILTIGLSVDANILLFERIREEIRAGKGMRLAIDDGFKHAMSSILDSNITLLILAIVLGIFGSGPIQGFAVTLAIA